MRQGFSETNLQVAWREMTNEDIAASIIGFIRQAALGDALVPYGDRVDKAMKKIWRVVVGLHRSASGWSGLVSS
jgi:hypothetical protein